MTSYLNYILEANIGLIMFMVAYRVILAGETNFSVQRLFLVAGMITSLAFPLVHLSVSNNSIPSLSDLLPSYRLPELTINLQGKQETQLINNGIDMWYWLGVLYIGGLVVSFSLFAIRLLQLTRKISVSSFFRVGKLRIIESSEHKHTFSFFNYIFLGRANELSADEKQKILQHEAIHARQYHSLDVLLVSVTGILFWFNPILKIYRKIFIQLHEFEADARAVRNHDVNDYCTLLAKVALQSADFTLASHFNNSLTVKRIQMMRTMKKKISTWKILALVSVVPMVFFILACQEQVMDDIAEIAKNSSNALVVPEDIQARYEELKKENPASTYILVEFNEAAEKQLGEMERKYGVPKQIELFTPDRSKSSMTIKSDAGVLIEGGSPQLQTFAIIEYNDRMKAIGDQSKSDGDVFTVVEDTATPNGGIPKFYEHIARTMSYPAEARKNGVVGKVFIEFVVQPDGAVTSLKTLKGIGMGCDEEAIRAIASYPDKWTPGKNNGVAVKQRMVLPVTFMLDDHTTADNQVKSPEGSIHEVVVAGQKPKQE